MIGFYTDECVRGQIISGLRKRGIDLITAVEDGQAGTADSAILDRATVLGRVLYTEDDDFLLVTAERQEAGIHFSGVVYAHPILVSIGVAIEHLGIIATLAEAAELDDLVTYLPLTGLVDL
jgi:hypothetical protein